MNKDRNTDLCIVFPKSCQIYCNSLFSTFTEDPPDSHIILTAEINLLGNKFIMFYITGIKFSKDGCKRRASIIWNTMWFLYSSTGNLAESCTYPYISIKKINKSSKKLQNSASIINTKIHNQKWLVKNLVLRIQEEENPKNLVKWRSYFYKDLQTHFIWIVINATTSQWWKYRHATLLLTSLADVSTNFIYDYNCAHKSLQDQELSLLQRELKL